MAVDAQGRKLIRYRGEWGYWQDDEESGEPIFIRAALDQDKTNAAATSKQSRSILDEALKVVSATSGGQSAPAPVDYSKAIQADDSNWYNYSPETGLDMANPLPAPTPLDLSRKGAMYNEQGSLMTPADYTTQGFLPNEAVALSNPNASAQELQTAYDAAYARNPNKDSGILDYIQEALPGIALVASAGTLGNLYGAGSMLSGGEGVANLIGSTGAGMGDTLGTAVASDVLAAPGGMFGLPEVAGAAAPGISGGTLASAIAPAAAAAVPAAVSAPAAATGGATASTGLSLPQVAAGASLAGTAATLGGGGGLDQIGSDWATQGMDAAGNINQDVMNGGLLPTDPTTGLVLPNFQASPSGTGNQALDDFIKSQGGTYDSISQAPSGVPLSDFAPGIPTGGSFWDELAKVVGGQASTATGLGGLKDLLGGVVGGFNAQSIADTYANTMKDAMAKYSDTMKYAVDQSDPFRDQRAQYQTQLADLVAGRTTAANNPNMMDTSQNNPNLMSLDRNNPYMMSTDVNNPYMMNTSRDNNPWLMNNNPVNNPAFMDTSANNPYMMNTNMAGNPNLMDIGPNNPYMKNTNLQNNPDLMSMSANNPYAMSMDRNNPWTMSTSTENNPWLAATQLDMNNPLMRNLSDVTIDNTLQRLTSKYGGDVSSLGVKDILTKQLNAVNAPLAMDYYKSGLANNQQYLSTATGNNMNYLNAAAGNNQKYLSTAADYNKNYLNTNTRANSDYLNTAAGFNTNYLNTASANNQKYLGTAAGYNTNYLNTATQNNTNYLNTATNNNQRYLGTAASNNQQYLGTAAANNQNLMRTAYGNNLDYMKTVGTAAGMNIQPNTGQVAATGAAGLSNLMSNYANQNTQLQNQAYGNYGVAANSALDMLFKAYNNYNTNNTSGGVSG